MEDHPRLSALPYDGEIRPVWHSVSRCEHKGAECDIDALAARYDAMRSRPALTPDNAPKRRTLASVKRAITDAIASLSDSDKEVVGGFADGLRMALLIMED